MYQRLLLVFAIAAFGLGTGLILDATAMHGFAQTQFNECEDMGEIAGLAAVYGADNVQEPTDTNLL